MHDINIKTLVLSTIRPHIVGLKTYYSELHAKMMAKVAGQDKDILTTNEVISALSTRVLELEAKILADRNEMAEIRSQLGAVKAALLSAGYDDVGGQLDIITSEWTTFMETSNQRFTEIEESIAALAEDPEPSPEVAPDPTPDDTSIDITLTPGDKS